MNGKLKSDLDRLWLEFHSGGITNPLTVIEQISYLMFARLLELVERRNERKARARARGSRASAPIPFKRIFPESQRHLLWSNLIAVGSEERMRLLNGSPTPEETASHTKSDPWLNLFQFFRTGLKNQDQEASTVGTLAVYFKDAQCMITKPTLASEAVESINRLPILEGDTKGDLYEYLLSKLSTAGVAGQFRTPRHIIRTIVRMIDPKPSETVCDPACGTGGFLTQTVDYLKEKYTSKGLAYKDTDDDGNPILDEHGREVFVYPGDQLVPYQDHMNSEMFHGFDFDATMLRIAAMNMILHNIESPCIENRDSLSEQADVFSKCAEMFDVVLANPPFKGSIDANNVHHGLIHKVKTRKTELLFLVLMEQLLKIGGRCGVIVPDGVLFGAGNAQKDVRKLLIEQNQLEAVVSLPAGVFRPYAGVSTAVLFFTKGGETKNVFFYDVEADGYSLDDKRNPVPESDLDDLVEKWNQWQKVRDGGAKKLAPFADRESKCFFVPKTEIVGQDYDLSLNKYKKVKYVAEKYPKPKTILAETQKLETEFTALLKELEEMI